MAALLSSQGLPTSDIDFGQAHFWGAYRDAALYGLVGLQPLAEIGLLRSVVVSPERRKAGLGRKLVDHAMGQAPQLGIRDVYLITDSASEFFRKSGFTMISRSDVPAEIGSTEQFKSLCPSTAAVMRRRLSTIAGSQ